MNPDHPIEVRTKRWHNLIGTILPPGTELIPIDYHNRDLKEGDTIVTWDIDNEVWLFLKVVGVDDSQDSILVHPSDMHGRIIESKSPYGMHYRYIFGIVETRVWRVIIPGTEHRGSPPKEEPIVNARSAGAGSAVASPAVASPAVASPAVASPAVASPAVASSHEVKPSCGPFGCFRRGGSRRNRKNKRKGSHIKRKQTRRRR